MNQNINIATYESQMKLMTGPNTPHEASLSNDARKQLHDDYMSLYFALSFANWGNDKTLGQAWYAGLEQIKQKVNSTDPNTPGGQYLRELHTDHKKEWSKTMMTSPHRDRKMECTPEQRREWDAKNTKLINDALGRINAAVPTKSGPDVTIPKDKAAKYEKGMSVLMKKRLQMYQLQQQNQYA